MVVDVTKDRNKYIGGSDARRIYRGDWHSLWMEKTERAKPADLSRIFPVQLGKCTEDLHMHWLIEVDGHDLRQPSIEDPLVFIDGVQRCHLDGIHNSRPQCAEVKHTNAFTPVEDQAIEYMAQIQHNIYTSKTDECLFSCILGNAAPHALLVGRNDLFLEELLEMEDNFWQLVTSDTEPETNPEPKVAKATDFVFDNLKPYDFSQNNEWVSSAIEYIDNQEPAKVFEAAKKNLKSIVPDDALSVTGAGVTIKRAKNGSLRFS